MARPMNELFRRFAHQVSEALGSPIAFIVAVLLVLTWAILGPVFQFSETWQLVINTGTTIITFLMVFVIQNTQNRDIATQQLKLDELLRAVKGARNRLIDLESFSDDQLQQLKRQFNELRTAKPTESLDRATAAMDDELQRRKESAAE
jgi:low affinity Fe/Cu permease